jgi:hypothetical protein
MKPFVAQYRRGAVGNNRERRCKDEHFVAEFYNVSVGTVRRWRYLGIGPRYFKIGNLVRYSLSDLYFWLDSRPTGGEQVVEATNE